MGLSYFYTEGRKTSASTITTAHETMAGVVSPDRCGAWSRSRHVNDKVDTEALIMSMAEFTFQDLDDAFLQEGCTVEMIENWLKDYSLCWENSCEDVPFNPKGNSLEDDFILGAEATALSSHHRKRMSVVLEQPNLKTMNLGYSMTSNTTSKTSSSISEVLTLCQADAETVLYNLGFACEKTCSTYKIPSRFFLIPSKAEGIDFTIYFDSLLHRIKRGDSSYIPADHGSLYGILHPLNNSYSYIRTPGKKETNLGHWTCSFFHEYTEKECPSY
ncbi:protein TESPA1 isoform X2 [Engystomops pustulosus]|uniref:protein TESPA1 isoform X2 n=1 Tax=Engystomops pustulosus TaxID=76066 RepID=UPI003AFAD1C0